MTRLINSTTRPHELPLRTRLDLGPVRPQHRAASGPHTARVADDQASTGDVATT
jgi:hypothetical protein